LEQNEDGSAVEVLVQIMNKNNTPNKRTAATLALTRKTQYKDKIVVPRLIEALDNQNSDIGKKAAIALGKIGGDEAVSGLLEALSEHENKILETAIVEGLGHTGEISVIEPLENILRYGKYEPSRNGAARSIAKIDQAKAMRIFAILLSENDTPLLSRIVLDVLVDIRNQEASDMLQQLPIHSGNSDLRLRIQTAILNINKNLKS
jgi:HEAT repeat protein